ncbi:MAG TPA: hypothetical protein VI937_00120 [Negativicutes bacterium]|nr:hypothetical protein [Negativicutes bacterium]
MTTLALTAKRAEQKVTAIAFPGIPWKLYYATAAVVLMVLLISYVYMVNQLTGGSYVVKNYNKEIRALAAENKELQTNFAESGFLGDVQEKAKELQFEKTADVTYVQLLQNSVGIAK